MLLKPESCKGCPFYKYSDYYVPDDIVDNASVFFIAQNPGEHEEQGKIFIGNEFVGKKVVNLYEDTKPKPLIGRTGRQFDGRFLPMASLQRHEVSVGNAIRCRPQGLGSLKAGDLPVITTKMNFETSETDIVKALKHCKAAHLHIPKSVKYIVPMGSYSLYSLTGLKSIMDWRGYGIRQTRQGIVENKNVDVSYYHDLLHVDFNSEVIITPTMHIAALFKGENKRFYHAVLQDFYKLRRLMNGEWPLPLPLWSNNPPEQWPQVSSFDTEYVADDDIRGDRYINTRLLRWSLYSSTAGLFCVEADNTTVIPIEPNSTVLIQNALADIAHLRGIVDISQVFIHDLMLAHSVLWTGEPHDLDYICSLYGAFNRYKHLSQDEPQLYSALDAFEPMYIWQNAFLPDFKKDRESWRVYKEKTLPLIDIIEKAQSKGIKLKKGLLQEAQQVLTSRVEEIILEAQKITGNPKFNIGGSKLLKEAIYGGNANGTARREGEM